MSINNCSEKHRKLVETAGFDTDNVTGCVCLFVCLFVVNHETPQSQKRFV